MALNNESNFGRKGIVEKVLVSSRIAGKSGGEQTGMTGWDQGGWASVPADTARTSRRPLLPKPGAVGHAGSLPGPGPAPVTGHCIPSLATWPQRSLSSGSQGTQACASRIVVVAADNSPVCVMMHSLYKPISFPCLDFLFYPT